MADCPSEQTIVDFLDGKLGGDAGRPGAPARRHLRDLPRAARALAPAIDVHAPHRAPRADAPDHAAACGRRRRGWSPSSVLPLVPNDRYDVRDEFARGGLGRIFRAHDRRLDRPVAVKQLIAGGAEAARRFVREALITARLQHPAIVPIYEAGRWPSGEPFYAMKLVVGPLARRGHRRRARRSPSGWRSCPTSSPSPRRWPTRTASASSTATSSRPTCSSAASARPWSSTGAWPRICVERRRGRAPTRCRAPYARATRPRSARCSARPRTCRPSRPQGEPVDERADVYALGAILYHLLAGAPPYPSGSSARGAGARARRSRRRRSTAREPGVPRDLVTIVEKAMARDPAHALPDGEGARRRPGALPDRPAGRGAPATRRWRWCAAGCRSGAPPSPSRWRC